MALPIQKNFTVKKDKLRYVVTWRVLCCASCFLFSQPHLRAFIPCIIRAQRYFKWYIYSLAKFQPSLLASKAPLVHPRVLAWQFQTVRIERLSWLCKPYIQNTFNSDACKSKVDKKTAIESTTVLTTVLYAI